MPKTTLLRDRVINVGEGSATIDDSSFLKIDGSRHMEDGAILTWEVESSDPNFNYTEGAYAETYGFTIEYNEENGDNYWYSSAQIRGSGFRTKNESNYAEGGGFYHSAWIDNDGSDYITGERAGPLLGLYREKDDGSYAEVNLTATGMDFWAYDENGEEVDHVPARDSSVITKKYFDNRLAQVGGGSVTTRDFTDSVIDFNYSTQKCTISANITFTFTNDLEGKQTILIVENSSGSTKTVAFAGAGISATQASVGVSAQSRNSYLLEVLNDGVFAQLIASDLTAPFPKGADGDLTIENGEIVTIEAGSIKDYNNIDIKTGGVLNITDPSNTGNLTEIYAAGTFNIDGQIISRDGDHGTISRSGNTAIGKSYSYTISQRSGGNAGRGGRTSNTLSLGGSGSSNGYGGGGGGGITTTSSSSTVNGGNGGTNNGSGSSGSSNGSSVSAGSGGSGNQGSNGANGNSGSKSGSTVKGGNGGNGGGSGGGGGAASRWVDAFFGAIELAGGGGGGGGDKGIHGGSLYLFCASVITGSGTINLSGRNGYRGGNGGNNYGSGNAYLVVHKRGGGGGGGGGAGGSGGHLRYTSPGLEPTVDVSGGSGGSGGSRGSDGGSGGNPLASENGSSGQSGNSGSSTGI